MTVSSHAESTPAGSPPESGELGRRVSRGLGWSLLGQGISRVGVFASGIVLARLLAPIDMGEVAAALLVVNVVLAINELGVIPAIVRWTGDISAASSTGATIAFVNSCLMYLVAYTVAPAVASVTNTPGSVGVIRIMALSVIVDGVIAVPLALLYRELRTVPQVLAEVGGMALYVLVAIGLASRGVDAEAIAWGRVIGAITTGCAIIAVSRWPSRPSFDVHVARRLLSFGVPLAASAAVFEAVMSIDYLIVGRELSGAALGVYLLAFNLSSWPVSVLSVAIGRVSFAGYAALAGDHARLVRGFVHSMAVALSCTVPLVLVLAAVAPELVEVVYGSTWSGAGAPLRWLLIVGGLRVLLQLVGEVIAVLGRTMAVFRLRCIWLLVLPLALDYGAERAGIRGVGIAHVVVACVLVVPLFLRELRISGIPLRALTPITVRPLLAAAAALLAMAAVAPLLDEVVTRLLVISTVGTIVYAAVIVPRNPVVAAVWKQLRGAPSSVPSAA